MKMKISSFTLVWAISLLPLNTFQSFGSNKPDATQLNSIENNDEYQPSFLFDDSVPNSRDSEKNNISENFLDEFVNAYKNISPEALKMSLNAYQYLLENNQLKKNNILTVVDFSKPSTEERLFVIDLSTKKIIAKSLCSHGKNSGENFATSFSNNNQSYQSSLGVFVANETYIGSKGFSLRLDGVESGINTNARERGVVIHAADYVSYDFIHAHGRLGRSQGCPALPLEKNEKIISMIKGGSCFFIYHPNIQYKKTSAIYKKYNEDSLQNFLACLD